MHGEVTIQVPFNGMSQKGKVVWSRSDPNENGTYEIGVELDRPENLWGVGFPPSDWNPARGSQAETPTAAILDLAPTDATCGSIPNGDGGSYEEQAESTNRNPESCQSSDYSSAPEQLMQLLDLSAELAV